MIFPVLFSIFANVAVIAIAAVAIYGTDNADDAGIANFSSYIDNMKYGSSLWGLALLFSAQSSCVTTTYTGQVSHPVAAVTGIVNMWWHTYTVLLKLLFRLLPPHISTCVVADS